MRFGVVVEKPLKVKYICHSNPAVRTPSVSYEQFSLFPGKAISSLRFNPLGVQMAPQETENNGSAKQTKSIMGMLWHFLGWSLVVIVKNRHVRLSSQQNNINFS